MRILVVDDNYVTAVSLEDILREEVGHEALSVGTAREGLRQRFLWRPEVVILDVRLPDGSGLDFLRDLRALSDREGLPHVPVVLTTGISEAELKDIMNTISTEGLGPVFPLQKPYDPPVLIQTLHAITTGTA